MSHIRIFDKLKAKTLNYWNWGGGIVTSGFPPPGSTATDLSVTGGFGYYTQNDAYEGRIQINNNIGDCAVALLSGALPPGYSIYVDNATHEVVVTWPPYSATYGQLVNSPNLGFELGDLWWSKGSGWTIETGNDPIDGLWYGVFDRAYGDSLIENQVPMPCVPGRVISGTMRIRQGASSKGNAGGCSRIEWLDVAMNVIGFAEGELIYSGSHGEVKYSPFSAIAPAGTAFVRAAARGFRYRQNERVQFDSFSWNAGYYPPATNIIGTNGVADIPLSLRVTDSAGRNADWTGTIYGLSHALSWASFNTGSTQSIVSHAYGNGVWLVGANNGVLSRSPDNGATWQQINLTGLGFNTAADIHGIAYSGAQWYITIYDRYITSVDDGKTWAYAVMQANNSNGAAGIFLIDGVLWVSSIVAGVYSIATLLGNTTIVVGTGSLAASSIVKQNGIYLIGTEGYILRGTTLANCVLVHTGSNNYSNFAYGNGIHVAANNGNTSARKSLDNGLTWAAITGYVSDVVFFGGLFYFGSGSSVYSSPDMITWTLVYTNSPSINYIIHMLKSPLRVMALEQQGTGGISF